MSRKRSSNSQHGPAPFSSSGSMIQTLPLNRWQTDDVEPFSSLGRPSKLQRTGLAPQPSVIIYENPDDYCSISETAEPRLSPSGPSKQYSPRNSYRHSSSPRQALALGSSFSQSPTTQMTGELTNAPTFTSVSMSRHSSHGGSSLCGGFDMMKLHSQTSFDGSSSPSSSVSFMSNTFILPPTIENSSSAKITKAAEPSASNHYRVSRRSLTEVNQSTRPIAPKVKRGAPLPTGASSAGHDLVRIESDEGTSKVAVPIPKAPYVRPSHDKVKCTQCNEHPNGFRGDHELRRHTERKHTAIRKFWTCKDISSDKKFLASCKACANNRGYNAYYNATAHLRRAHFNPKMKGRKGKIEPEDRRGGKGGGKEPSMEVLKEWLEYHEERVPANTQSSGDELEDSVDGEIPYELLGVSNFHESSIFADQQHSSISSESPLPNFTNQNVLPFVNGATHPPSSSFVAISPPYSDDCLQLTAPVANHSDLFDLSLDTSINEPSMTDSADFLSPSDILMSSSYLFDGFNNPFLDFP